MKTIREAFKQAMNLTEEKVLPLPVTYCFESIALICYVDTCSRTGQEPDEKILRVLRHDDITSLASLSQFLQLSGFLRWWFEQEATNVDFDDDGNEITGAWWDTSEIIASWNKYAEMEREKR